MRYLLICLFVGLAGCAPASLTPAATASGTDSAAPAPVPGIGTSLSLQAKARSFARVVAALEPVVEAECRRRRPTERCDFQMVIDDRPGQGTNAFQTEDAGGRPVIGFTPALIVMAANEDELAFVMAHEAAHHILGHLQRQRRNAQTGAQLLGGLARLVGRDSRGVRSAQELGATVGVRSYSKDYELEADALGARLAARGGFDPLRGAAFFTRVPDPGVRFLGTHPPNAQRLEVVRAAIAP